MKRTYSDKLRDPRWQQKRLKLLEATEWKCQSCESGTTNLQVHHQYYLRNTDPWDYEDDCYKVLCENCHEIYQKSMESAHKFIARSNLILALEKMSETSEKEQALFCTVADVVFYEPSIRLKVLSICSDATALARDSWSIAVNYYKPSE